MIYIAHIYISYSKHTKQGCASTIQDGSDDCLRAYMPGDFFGELALLTGDVRAATVKATQDAVVSFPSFLI